MRQNLLETNAFQRLKERTKAVLTAIPACHDWDHTLRVINNAKHITEIEGADMDVTVCAALLHDIGRPDELADQGLTCHAVKGAQIAEKLLKETAIGDHIFVEQVVHCVRAHRYRRRDNLKPQSLEAKIVFDADKLDSIGAVGIGRAFHFAGRIGARLHNQKEEALHSKNYSREDTAYREYLVKLQYIHENMLTAEGRRLAASRHRFMTDYFTRICKEAEGEDY